jgi:hypothetical protein
MSRAAHDHDVDRRLGLRDAANGGITVISEHPFGRPVARASLALDGDRATAWNSPLGAKPQKEYMRVEVPEPVMFDHLNLALVEDGRHSVPTQMQIVNESGETRLFDIPPAIGDPDAHGTVEHRVSFPAITGRGFEITIPRYTQVKKSELLMPVGIAELGIPGVARTSVSNVLPDDCVDDLVRIDGKPFSVRITGSVDDATMQRPLGLEPCDPDAVLELGPGEHRIETQVSPKTKSGVDVSHLTLTSAAGGAAAPVDTIEAFPGKRSRKRARDARRARGPRQHDRRGRQPDRTVLVRAGPK